jgi:para-nitrobenzyl esterase
MSLKPSIAAILIAGSCCFIPMGANAAEPASGTAAAQPLTTSATQIGVLLDDPSAKAILVKYIPQLANNAQIAMARNLTLKQIQAYAGDQLTDETLGKIDWDLSKLPPKS